MNVVYFSHSYRKEDADSVRHFGRLMRSEGFLPSLDPPSDSVNSSKLERHLRSSDGLVAVLNWRKDGVSKYILFEINLCIRAQKPLLVFVEDNLPDNIIPAGILQSRFSRRSYLRQIREHRHALQILKSYIGDQPPPRYQPVSTQRSCSLVGTTELPKETIDLIHKWLETRGYNAIDLQTISPFQFQDPEIYEALLSADLALCNVDSTTPQSQYMLGAIQASFIPSITFTTNASYNYYQSIPKEFQPRLVNPSDLDLTQGMLDIEMDLFEEDFIELDKSEEVETYASLLIDMASLKGHYEETTRQVFTEEIIMGNKISFGNVSGSIVNVDSMLEQVTQSIGSANNVDESTKKQLTDLIDQLKAELQKAPASKKEEAEAMAEYAKTFVEAGTKPQPNKTTIQITAKGLKEAAENIAGVMPTVLTIATGIVKTVFLLTGIPLP
jgi:hypothetical protein